MNPSACLLQIGIYHGCFQIVSGLIAAAPEALVNTLFKNQFAESALLLMGKSLQDLKNTIPAFVSDVMRPFYIPIPTAKEKSAYVFK